MATKPKVAFIGLGAMGMGMALHLVEDGFPVSGFDVNPKALETLASKGGFAASSPQESAGDASYIVCMAANAE
jgi:3-hydroxyisobutyrate dehydrogenase